jgi:hypothetical protein
MVLLADNPACQELATVHVAMVLSAFGSEHIGIVLSSNFDFGGCKLRIESLFRSRHTVTIFSARQDRKNVICSVFLDAATAHSWLRVSSIQLHFRTDRMSEDKRRDFSSLHNSLQQEAEKLSR